MLVLHDIVREKKLGPKLPQAPVTLFHHFRGWMRALGGMKKFEKIYVDPSEYVLSRNDECHCLSKFLNPCTHFWVRSPVFWIEVTPSYGIVDLIQTRTSHCIFLFKLLFLHCNCILL